MGMGTGTICCCCIACCTAYAGPDDAADDAADGSRAHAHELPGARSDAHAVLHDAADRGAAAAAGGGPEGWEFPREPDAQGLAQAPAPEQAAGLPRAEGAERAQDFRRRAEP